MSVCEDSKAAMSRGVSDRRVFPDDLSEGFRKLGLSEGESVVLHVSLEAVGDVDGGAAMIIHRLLRAIGKEGTLLVPTFTSATRHSSMHDDYTKVGCWCGGQENRHLPFIPELQPDKEIGAVAHRLCSWPASRRSTHPAYSFAAVGEHVDELVRESAPLDPLLPLRKFLKHNPKVLTIGVEFEAVTAIHLAVERKTPAKFRRERALAISSKGPVWVDVLALGCAHGFGKVKPRMGREEFKEARIGFANAGLYSLKGVVEQAEALLDENGSALSCGNVECLSCARDQISDVS